MHEEGRAVEISPGRLWVLADGGGVTIKDEFACVAVSPAALPALIEALSALKEGAR